MGHKINAVIGKIVDVSKIAEDWVHAKIIELPQDFGMVPMTAGLLENVSELMEISDGVYCSELDALDETVIDLLERYSFRTKLAYIETDYFGGVGAQGGVLYENGREVCPPRVGEGVINELLKELGAWHRPGSDEFDSLGLGKYRHVPDE